MKNCLEQNRKIPFVLQFNNLFVFSWLEYSKIQTLLEKITLPNDKIVCFIILYIYAIAF